MRVTNFLPPSRSTREWNRRSPMRVSSVACRRRNVVNRSLPACSKHRAPSWRFKKRNEFLRVEGVRAPRLSARTAVRSEIQPFPNDSTHGLRCQRLLRTWQRRPDCSGAKTPRYGPDSRSATAGPESCSARTVNFFQMILISPRSATLEFNPLTS